MLTTWSFQNGLVILISFVTALIVVAFGFLGWSSRLRSQRLLRREIPYIVGPPVEGEDAFFGRRELMDHLINTISGGSRAVVGEWRIGKTSIQRELKRRLGALSDPTYVYYPVFIDLSHLGSGGDRAFFRFLGRQLLRYARDRVVPSEVLERMSISRAEMDDDEDYDSLSLEQDIEPLVVHWRTEVAPRLPILVLQIDECSRLAQLTVTTLLAFRALFMGPLAANLRTVLSGRAIPRKEDEDGSLTCSLSPWWNFLAQEIVVEPLTPAEARNLIVRPARGLFTYDEAAIEKILAVSEGKPSVVQSVCSEVMRYKYSLPRQGRAWRRVSLKDVRASRERRPGGRLGPDEEPSFAENE